VIRVAAITALSVASLALGSMIGSPALFALAAAVSLVVTYGAVGVLTASRWVAAERWVAAAEVVEGQPLEVEICLALRHHLGVVCELTYSGAAAEQLHPGRNRVLLVFERRGRYVLAPSTIRLRDPLGLFAAERQVGHSVPLLVLPRSQAGPRASSFHTPPQDGQAVDPDGLGEYRAGTPASRLHWASLARGAGLLERRLTDERVETPLYVVDTSGAAGSADADRIVRAAVAEILRAARAGGCAVLLSGDDALVRIGPDLRGWPDVHRRLALLGRAR